jgi:hypothetical protein
MDPSNIGKLLLYAANGFFERGIFARDEGLFGHVRFS